jgi:hypothetical protein
VKRHVTLLCAWERASESPAQQELLSPHVVTLAHWRKSLPTSSRATRSLAYLRFLTQGTLCGSFARETGNTGGARACIRNWRMKWFYRSNLSSCWCRTKRAGCGRVQL